MTITWLTYLIVCPLVFLGGFVDAVAGGGGLISLPAYMIAGLPAHFAIATNKISSAMGTSISTFKLGKSGHIPWKIAIPCIVAAIVGSSCGANLALLVDANVFKIIMLFIIPATALYVFRNRKMGEEPVEISKTSMVIRATLVALVIGVYDGFYGPGTGTFLILLLSGFAHMRLKESNGVAKSINLTTNIGALAVYLLNGKAMITLGLIAGIFGIAGNYIGVTLFMEKGSKAVKPIMITVLTIFFIKILTELL